MLPIARRAHIRLPRKATLAQTTKVLILVAAIGLVPASIAFGVLRNQASKNARESLDQNLRTQALAEVAALESTFARARTVTLITAQNPAFRDFYALPGDRLAKARSGSPTVARVNEALAYVHRLFPGAIGEASFIDASGAENARAVRGVPGSPEDLSPAGLSNPLFAPTLALGAGEVYQARPYVSRVTGEWVVSSSTLVPGSDGEWAAIVHFEVTVESFRAAAGARRRFDVTVVNGGTGRVVFDAGTPLGRGIPLGWPDDDRFAAVVGLEEATGAVNLDRERAVFARLPSVAGNENDWYVVAHATPASGSFLGAMKVPMAMMGVALLLIGLGMARRWVKTNAELEHRALHDALTGLQNRTVFRERILQAIAASRREGTGVAVLIMDLDSFKDVNDTLGHHCGDLLLQQVAARLRATVRTGDTIARLGGDEFAVLLPGVSGVEDARETARRIQAELDEPFLVEDVLLHTEASIGIALYPEHGLDADSLIKRADVAMYVAKRTESGHELYSALHDANTDPTRLSLVGELRRGIADGQLIVHYQPKANMVTGEVTGVEALVRWRHPEHGLLAPGEFMPLAEPTGLIGPLTLFVLDAALEQWQRWHETGLDLVVAVNLSVRSLLDPHLPAEIAAALRRWRVPPERLELELTESAIMTDQARARSVLGELSALGARLVIDDFGSGYSSLGYLKRLPVDVVKIDRSFVLRMTNDPHDAVVVQSTIDLGHNLGLEVVAEGVESAECWSMLASLGCDTAQGYFLSPPRPAEELTAWLTARFSHSTAIAVEKRNDQPRASNRRAAVTSRRRA